MPAGTVDGLLKPEAKATLTKILTCHVIAANAMSDAVMKMVDDDGGMHKVKTVGGCELTLKYKDGKVMVEDETGGIATVTIADVAQSNGVIHVIDKVLCRRCKRRQEKAGPGFFLARSCSTKSRHHRPGLCPTHKAGSRF